MIVVTGGNGKLGRAVIDGLLSPMPADQIAASVRDSGKAMRDVLARGLKPAEG